MRPYFIQTLVFCGLLVACSKPFAITSKVDALVRSDFTERKSYFLVYKDNAVPQGDLQFTEFSIYTERMLHVGGRFKRVEAPEKADLIVVISYGIGDPMSNIISETIPLFGSTGGSSTNTTGTVTFGGNFAIFSSHQVQSPSFGLVGAATNVRSVTTYPRFIVLEGYESKAMREKGLLLQVFRTKATSIGTSDDLRRTFPLMLASMSPYIGAQTPHMIEIRQEEGSRVWNYVKNGNSSR